MASQLRYMGFDQAKNIREYKFDGVAAGETTTHLVVNADLALFERYHVGLQEGPALCLKKLSADLEALQQCVFIGATWAKASERRLTRGTVVSVCLPNQLVFSNRTHSTSQNR